MEGLGDGAEGGEEGDAAEEEGNLCGPAGLVEGRVDGAGDEGDGGGDGVGGGGFWVCGCGCSC